MRIAHVCLGRPRPDTANGVDNTIYSLSKAQAAIGDSVSVFSVSEKQAHPIPGVDVEAYRPTRLPYGLPGPLARDLLASRPDVVHLHSVYTPLNYAVARLLRRRGVPFVVRPAGGLSPVNERRHRTIKTPFKHLFELPMMNASLFVHSFGDTEDIRKYGTDAPIVTTSKGVEVEETSAIAARAWIHERYPRTADSLLFVFLGRCDPLHKGLDLLLRGFAEADLKNVQLLMAGPDWNGSVAELKRLAEELDIDSRVIFPGPLFGRDKLRLLAGGDAFIHPSRWEGGVPHAILEAAALSVPILTTPHADTEGTLDRYQACVKVDANASAVAAGLVEMESMDVEARAAMGRNAKRMTQTEFTWEAAAAQVKRAYQEYLHHSGRTNA